MRCFLRAIDPHQVVLRVCGPDVFSFLHGLCTANITGSLQSGKALYGCFLNSEGRTICDAFFSLPHSTEGNSVLVEVDALAADFLLEHLKEHKLRQKLQFYNETEQQGTCVVISTMREDKDLVGFVDPRNFSLEAALGIPPPVELNTPDTSNTLCTPLLMRRIYCSPDEAKSLVGSENRLQDFYTLLALSGAPYGRYLFNVPSDVGLGKGERSLSLPFEGNADQILAISFTKGCYLGQELTHRTHVMLSPRKRTFPLFLGHAGMYTRLQLRGLSKTTKEHNIEPGGNIQAEDFIKSEELLQLESQEPDAAAGNGCALYKYSCSSSFLSGVDQNVPTEIWGKSSFGDEDRNENFIPGRGEAIYALQNSSSKKNLQQIGTVGCGAYNFATGLIRFPREWDKAFFRDNLFMHLYLKKSKFEVYELLRKYAQLRNQNGLDQPELKLFNSNESVNDKIVASVWGPMDGENRFSALLPPDQQLIPITAYVPRWWDDSSIEKLIS